MITKHLSPLRVVVGLFLAFFVIIPIMRDVYYYKHSDLSMNPMSCRGCLEGKQQPADYSGQRVKIECRNNCIQNDAKSAHYKL